MNPAVEKQLKLLGQNLAARHNQPQALFELPPKSGVASVQAPPPPPQRLAEAHAVVSRKGDTEPLRESLESFSARQVARVAGKLNPTAYKVYGLLNRLGCTVARDRGYHRKAKQVSFFCPAEVLTCYLNLSRGSFYRSLKELVLLGLVDARGHKTTLNGWAVRCDGTLWSVRLFPTRGPRAKLRYEDLKARYRDLEADIAAKKTVWQQMRQSSTNKAGPVTFTWILTWTLPPFDQENPLLMTVAPGERLDLELILDVPCAPKESRRDAVDQAARALAHHLQDLDSLDFYRYLLWQLVRLYTQDRDHFRSVYQMALRARADVREGFARRAGGLLITRLKACGLWQEIREVLLVRVAA